MSDSSHQPTSTNGEVLQPDSPESKASASMQEYYSLQQELLVATLACTGIIFISVWIFYNLNIALNYLIGACTGVVYLRMLAKDVERLGNEKQRLSKTRFALFIGLIIIATQWRQLHVIPIFLGFLTYKAALIIYTVRTTLPSDPK
ncbi:MULTISPECIES: ATP synthase subunit I [Aerosakkonema]|uniref:ATP synthase subunit I n=1 Tax=Aerosakkonema TaxID=1246629 RepID=UPI0035B92398